MCTELKFQTWFNVALKVVGQVVHSLLDEKASEKKRECRGEVLLLAGPHNGARNI